MIVNAVGVGVVDRSAQAARDAAIGVIQRRVPGVTRRVVRAMHFTLPIGLLLMIGGVVLANTIETEQEGNEAFYYLGIPLGAYMAYSPVESERESIKREAEEAATKAGGIARNLCTIQ